MFRSKRKKWLPYKQNKTYEGPQKITIKKNTFVGKSWINWRTFLEKTSLNMLKKTYVTKKTSVKHVDKTWSLIWLDMTDYGQNTLKAKDKI